MIKHKEERLNNLIKEELGAIIQKGLELEGDIFISVGTVDITPDMAVARVWVDIWPTEKGNHALGKLKKNSGNLRKELAQKIKMRRVPRLIFFIDKEEIEDDKQRKKVEDVLEKLRQEQEG